MTCIHHKQKEPPENDRKLKGGKQPSSAATRKSVGSKIQAGKCAGMRSNNELIHLSFLFGEPSSGSCYYVASPQTKYPTQATHTSLQIATTVPGSGQDEPPEPGSRGRAPAADVVGGAEVEEADLEAEVCGQKVIHSNERAVNRARNAEPPAGRAGRL